MKKGKVLYTWDIIKEKRNIKKHNVTFITASRVFNDANVVINYDYKHSENEDRYNAIGMVDNLLFVVYTEDISMDSGKIYRHIISARRATKEEKNEYIHSNDRRGN